MVGVWNYARVSEHLEWSTPRICNTESVWYQKDGILNLGGGLGGRERWFSVLKTVQGCEKFSLWSLSQRTILMYVLTSPKSTHTFKMPNDRATMLFFWYVFVTYILSVFPDIPNKVLLNFFLAEWCFYCFKGLTCKMSLTVFPKQDTTDVRMWIWQWKEPTCCARKYPLKTLGDMDVYQWSENIPKILTAFLKKKRMIKVLDNLK